MALFTNPNEINRPSASSFFVSVFESMWALCQASRQRLCASTALASILGKGGRPKKATTIVTDTGRIHRHIVPLIGPRRVKDLSKADINKVLKDIMAGKTRASIKTKKLRGKAIVRGGAGTATRTVGLLGGILTMP
jgi:hypothetical protein